VGGGFFLNFSNFLSFFRKNPLGRSLPKNFDVF